ncbi:hypothetical protein QE385_003986 [Sphingomonas sp. SORGH_AS 950]|uniref:hypothetical protein n=1 Tax=Sphingomonas sp. SORGH_AS_0950 TaxID=3041792 RepID=UPI002783865C|nr:hypothetical protein [Sphingomonas sp. SORGH_AS_0950]MDQ1159589.1 hypothetical protein [Sphingomonas sp. SORGH_AS_0950]
MSGYSLPPVSCQSGRNSAGVGAVDLGDLYAIEGSQQDRPPSVARRFLRSFRLLLDESELRE